MKQLSSLFLVLLCSSCFPCDYLADRGYDAMDMFALNISGGYGYDLGFEYGISSFGSASGAPENLGLDGRQAGYWIESRKKRAFLPISLLAIPVEWVKTGFDDIAWNDPEVSDYLWGADDSKIEEWHGNRLFTKERHFRMSPLWIPVRLLPGDEVTERPWADAFPIGVHAMFGLGIRVQFRPVQALDFILGIFFIDMAGDDSLTVTPEENPEKVDAKREKPSGTEN